MHYLLALVFLNQNLELTSHLVITLSLSVHFAIAPVPATVGGKSRDQLGQDPSFRRPTSIIIHITYGRMYNSTRVRKSILPVIPHIRIVDVNIHTRSIIAVESLLTIPCSPLTQPFFQSHKLDINNSRFDRTILSHWVAYTTGQLPQEDLEVNIHTRSTNADDTLFETSISCHMFVRLFQEDHRLMMASHFEGTLEYVMQLKGSLVSFAILLIAVLALTTPLYPVQVNQEAYLTSSFTTLFEAPTVTYEVQTVYSLTEPVTLTGLTGPEKAIFVSVEFELQSNFTYEAEVTCQPCEVGKGSIFLFLQGNKKLLEYPLYYDVPGHGHGTLTVPRSGIYGIMIYCINSCTISNVSLNKVVRHNFQVTRTVTPYSTATLTISWQTKLPVYSILGVLASAVILLLLALLVLLTVLIEIRTLPAHSTRRRRHGKSASTSRVL